jgi:hypothetical protein
METTGMPSRSWRSPALGLLAWTWAGFAAVTAAHAAEPTSRDWDKNFAVGAHPIVHVTSDDARIVVRTGPPGAVHGHVRYYEHHWGFTSRTHDPRVDMVQNGDDVTITIKQPTMFMLFGAVDSRLEVNLAVPEACDLVIQSGDGSVTLEQPVEGRIAVTTGDGRIIAHGTRGDMRFHSGDGAVICDSLDGMVAVRSGDGHVQLSGRFDKVENRSGDGRVEITAEKGSRMTEDWDIETSDGPLTVRIPQDLQAELDAHAGDGTIRFQLPVSLSEPLDRHTIRGMINGGGPVLRLRTGDGTLTLATSD